MKKANKQATIFVGRSLTLQIFCFMLTGYNELHNRDAFIVSLYDYK